tara:strand:- start:351 stop:641 length:291 start_codon:yes stop_codon:yes gene_type:complete
MFKDLTKIQINQETGHVHLAIRITDHHVHNLCFSLEAFMCAVKKGSVSYHNWNIQTYKDKIKIFSNDYVTHYRFSIEEWESIKRQFAMALSLLKPQ